MVVRLAVAAGRCGRGKRKVDFRGSGCVSGIGRRVIIKNCMGNQTNSMFVEERDRKNFSFLEKWSRVLPRRFSENISHQLLLNYMQLFKVSVWSITPGFDTIYKLAMSKSIIQ